jgi:hypothetical protein
VTLSARARANTGDRPRARTPRPSASRSPERRLRIGAGCVLLATILIAASPTWASPPLDEARRFFARFVILETSFDSALVDLYSSDASIRVILRDPDTGVREIVIPGEKYQELLRAALPIAKQKGDTNEYSEVSYRMEGVRVRIDATRYSKLKQHSSPLSMLIGSDDGGRWWILEETSETRP